jgi:hypothetical protein
MNDRLFLLSVRAVALALVPLLASAADFEFRHRFIDDDLPGSSWGQTAIADVDRDGKLDFITGRSRGEILWYRQERLTAGCGTRWANNRSPTSAGRRWTWTATAGWISSPAGVVSQHRQTARGAVRTDRVRRRTGQRPRCRAGGLGRRRPDGYADHVGQEQPAVVPHPAGSSSTVAAARHRAGGPCRDRRRGHRRRRGSGRRTVEPVVRERRRQGNEMGGSREHPVRQSASALSAGHALRRAGSGRGRRQRSGDDRERDQRRAHRLAGEPGRQRRRVEVARVAQGDDANAEPITR